MLRWRQEGKNGWRTLTAYTPSGPWLLFKCERNTMTWQLWLDKFQPQLIRAPLSEARWDGGHANKVSVRQALLSIRKYGWMFVDPMSKHQTGPYNNRHWEIEMPIVKEE